MTDGGGLGLSQLRSRLQSYYNGKAHFTVDSLPNKGTTITIEIETSQASKETEINNAVMSL